MNIKKTSFGCLVIASVVFMGQASAQIYKCESQDGNVFYNNLPCPVTNKETEMEAVKDVKDGYVPPAIKQKTNVEKEPQAIVNYEVANKANREKKKQLKSKVEDLLSKNTSGRKGNSASKVGIEIAQPRKEDLPAEYAYDKKDDNNDDEEDSMKSTITDEEINRLMPVTYYPEK